MREGLCGPASEEKATCNGQNIRSNFPIPKQLLEIRLPAPEWIVKKTKPSRYLPAMISDSQNLRRTAQDHDARLASKGSALRSF